jgi:hypothetical protein
MKLLLIISSLFLLVSCTQYRYEVTYEKCNWHTWSLSYKNSWLPYLSDRNRKLFIPESKWEILDTPSYEIRNVCDFSYTREEIK